MSAEPTAVGITSTTSTPTSSMTASVRAATGRSTVVIPTGLRRARAGRERGVEDVNVDRQEDGPVAHEADRAADGLLDPRLAHVVHEVAGDAVLPACRANSASPGQ